MSPEEERPAPELDDSLATGERDASLEALVRDVHLEPLLQRARAESERALVPGLDDPRVAAAEVRDRASGRRHRRARLGSNVRGVDPGAIDPHLRGEVPRRHVVDP